MDAAERAGQIVEAIQQARGRWPIGATFTVSVRGGCAACDPGACGECGHLFTGEIFTIEHLTRGKRVITDRTRKEMQKILAEIQSGKFAREWMAENKNGRPNFNKMRAESAKHPVEKVGAKLRSMMSWMKKS